MPGKVKVKILSGRNLPIMDRGSDTTDAYVEIKLANITHKTDVCRKTLNPQWNSEWFRFELDDEELQDEPLQIRLMDYDTYSANDSIGKVSISLNPLLLPAGDTKKGSVMSGFIPVFDTMNGIRGEVNVIVKVDLFSDANKFRQSSCGVQFFHSSIIPHGFMAQIIHGFVEELIVNDDPEYQWIDKIRTPRASNEARQVVFLRLSGQVQRKIGLKALDLGANAVIGYQQSFDLEGDVGVVARGIGTAVTLVKLPDNQPQTLVDNSVVEENETATSPSKQLQQQPGHHIRTESSGGRILISQSPAKLNIGNNCMMTLLGKDGGGIFRRSSDSDLSVTPKGNSLTSGERIGGMMRVGNITHTRPPLNQENLDMLEYPFLTIAKYPLDFIRHIGATVAARSVKLLERVPNPDQPETRDSWWTELRMEIRSHARALGCNIVIGYSEVTTISDDVCVLSATGTAAVINLQYSGGDYLNVSKEIMTSSLDRQEFEYDIKEAVKDLKINQTKLPEKVESEIETVIGVGVCGGGGINLTPGVNKENNLNLLNSGSVIPKIKSPNCTICHIPYNQNSVPFHVTMKKCASCKRGKVPDVIFVTIDIPEGIQITGRGCFLQAQVCRPKRDLRSELNAKEISDGLPFLEYELHRVLINKLKIKGMNAIFGLKATVAIGERMMSLIATGTAVYLTSLPPAKVPKVVAGNSWSDMEKLNELQKALHDTSDRNKEIYQLKYNLDSDIQNSKIVTSDTEDDSGDEELTEMDLNFGNKDTCVLEVDDIEDLEIIASLMERCPPDGFHVVNTQTVPGLHDLEAVRNLQMFTQVWRAKFPINQCNLNFSKHFQRILQSIYFKLRRMTPCAICDLKYRLDFPETDEIQILVTGMALGLSEPKMMKPKRKLAYPTTSTKEDELIFNLDEDIANDGFSHPNQTHSMKIRNKSPTRCRLNSGRFARHLPVKERNGVDITPLSFIPGGVIERYLGNLNFFFIRESTSVREIGGFVHSFITELLAIVRAQVLALGGNAMVAFYMTELILVDNPHKNQGQCIISVGGDVVHVSYINDD